MSSHLGIYVCPSCFTPSAFRDKCEHCGWKNPKTIENEDVENDQEIADEIEDDFDRAMKGV